MKQKLYLFCTLGLILFILVLIGCQKDSELPRQTDSGTKKLESRDAASDLNEARMFVRIIHLGVLELLKDEDFIAIVDSIATATEALNDTSDYYAKLSQVEAAYTLRGWNLINEMESSMETHNANETELNYFDENELQTIIGDVTLSARLFLPYKSEEYFGEINLTGTPESARVLFNANTYQIYPSYYWASTLYSASTVDHEDIEEESIWLISAEIIKNSVILDPKVYELAGKCAYSTATWFCTARGKACKCDWAAPPPQSIIDNQLDLFE